MKLKERVARTIFHQEKPRSSWQKHPNYRQLQDQEYRISCAARVIRTINELTGSQLDPDQELPDNTTG